MLACWGRLSLAACGLVAGIFIGVPAFADKFVAIQQGWTIDQKKQWYSLSQGSRLIPLDWLRALKQMGDNNKPFLDAANIEKFRYLPNVYSQYGLPVGFTVDEQVDGLFGVTRLVWKKSQLAKEKWVGMNCSACHTQEITYKDSRMRVEGAPTLADFRGFIVALNDALAETINDADRFNRFVADMRQAGVDVDETEIKKSLKKLVAWQENVEKANFTDDTLPYGFARLDAFGHIFNKVALSLEMDDMRQRRHVSSAPVSYPFLWNVPQLDKVQWNGIANNIKVPPAGGLDVGALGRNVGEVIGVFADVKWHIEPAGESDRLVLNTSADIGNLIKLEQQLESLRPPLWPTGTLGKIEDRRSRGREVFVDENRTRPDGSVIPSCNSCHKSLRRNSQSLTRRANTVMVPLKEIGTDIWMACNAVTNRAYMGYLNRDGTKRYTESAVVDLTSRTVIENVVDLRNLAKVGLAIFSKARSKIDKSFELPSKDGLERHAAATLVPATPGDEAPQRTDKQQELYNKCINGKDKLLAYKSRLLTGIWATAPYLHNGSVPTLYDLLLPPDQRPKSFAVGTREFDPVRVGFVTRDPACKIPDKAAEGASPYQSRDSCKLVDPSGDNSFPFQTRDAAGRIIDGNSNAGHDYGNAWFTDDDRWALVEYMKGL